MMKHLIRAAALVLAAAFFLSGLAGCGDEDKTTQTEKQPAAAKAPQPEEKPKPKGLDRTPTPDEIAAVNGVPVARADYEREVARLEQQLIRAGHMPDDEQIRQLKEMAVINLVHRELLRQSAREKGYEVDEEAIQKNLADIKSGFSKEEDFQNAIKRMKFSEEDILTDLRRGNLIEQFVRKEFFDKTVVTDEDARKFYDGNPDLFKQPEMVRASHIIVKVDMDPDETQKAEALKRIEEVRDKALKGEDFGALAREYSEGPTSARDGDLGFFSHGQMVESFEKAAFALEVGQMSDIVRTEFGYHLIKKTDYKPESVTPFEESKDKILAYLKDSGSKDLVEKHLAGLKESANIEFFMEDKPEPGPANEKGTEDDQAQ